MLKPETRIIAWDDCAFSSGDKLVQIIGAIFRGGKFLDGLLSTTITKDGMDATDRITESILKTRHYDQLSLIMLNGISFAGLNIVDIKTLHEKTKLPVLVVIRKKPDAKGFLDAMKNLPDYEERAASVENAGPIYSYSEIFYQKAGLAEDECVQIFKLTCVQSNIPEPLRVAHLIASGLSRQMKDVKPSKEGNTLGRISSLGFESRGRA